MEETMETPNTKTPKDQKSKKVVIRLSEEKHANFRIWLIRNKNSKAQTVLENTIDALLKMEPGPALDKFLQKNGG
jgi:hypothetical protein